MSAVHLEGLSVSLPGSGRVLDEVGLSLRPGECLAVVGESGAGKSVLARTLLGMTQEQPGARVRADRFEIAGEDVAAAPPRLWRSLRGRGISLVLQDALQSLDPLRTVEAEVAETLAVHRVSRGARRARVVKALEDAGLPDASSRLRQRSEELSGGMRQRVLIASALVGGAPVIVADEPTTALDATVAVRILDLLAGLRDEGRALLLISHDLDAVRRVTDRVAVIDAGRIVEIGAAHEIFTAPRHPVTRALLAAAPRGPKAQGTPPPGALLVSATGLARSFRGPGRTRVPAVDDVDLEVRSGEVVGVVGESGSGKSTLARLLVGADRPDAGDLSFPAGPARVRLVPQDPLGSFDPRWPVGRILAAASRNREETPAALLERVGLVPETASRRPVNLSGGQRQRVAIARALAARPALLVCDEPVSALDVTTQAGILSLLMDLQRTARLGIVFISHDLAVVRQVSDRVLVMRAGRIVEQGPTERVFTAPEHPFTRDLVAATR